MPGSVWGEGQLEGGQKEREREKEEIKGWGGGDRGTEKQRTQRKKKANSGQCCGSSVLGRVRWSTSGLGEREKEAAGVKGQLSDRWARARSGEVKTGSIVIGFHNFPRERDWNFVTSLSWDSRLNFFKGSADRLCEAFHALLSRMNVVQNNKTLIKKVKPGTGSDTRS